jgi:hypothetical protein
MKKETRQSLSVLGSLTHSPEKMSHEWQLKRPFEEEAQEEEPMKKTTRQSLSVELLKYSPKNVSPEWQVQRGLKSKKMTPLEWFSVPAPSVPIEHTHGTYLAFLETLRQRSYTCQEEIGRKIPASDSPIYRVY